MCGGCETLNHFKAVCRSTQRQAGTNQNSRSIAVHVIGQETAEDKLMDGVNIKSLNFNSTRFVIITKLELATVLTNQK